MILPSHQAPCCRASGMRRPLRGRSWVGSRPACTEAGRLQRLSWGTWGQCSGWAIDPQVREGPGPRQASEHHQNPTRRDLETVTNPAAAAAAKWLQPCPTLCDPTDGRPPGSSHPQLYIQDILVKSTPGVLRTHDHKATVVAFIVVLWSKENFRQNSLAVFCSRFSGSWEILW